MDQITGMLGKLGTFASGAWTTVSGWISSLMGAIVPSSTDSTGKAGFVKWILIIAALYFGAKILRLNIGVGGKRR